MNPNKSLADVASRVVWFDPPEQTLANPRLFLAHLMVYGTAEEVTIARQHFSPAEFEAVLDDPPSGVFDVRSWNYWNIVFDRDPPPPLPAVRKLPE